MKKGNIVKVKFDENLSRLNQVEGEVLENISNPTNTILTPRTKIKVKNVIPGKEALVQITKFKKKKLEGALVEYLDDFKPGQEVCENCLECGGCTFNLITPEEELKIKENYLKDLFSPYPFSGLTDVTNNRNYRNKMEYSFGNSEKEGELTLGLHQKNKFYNILNSDGCQLVPEDFETIRKAVLEYFKKQGADFYHKNTHHGFLRFLVLRHGQNSGDILVNLVTTTQDELNKEEFVEMLENLELNDKITGILWTRSDAVADAVVPEETEVLAGSENFNDSILGVDFTITPYSFFQVNTKGAEELFTIVRDYAKEALGTKKDNIIYDLYSGTGTIGILLSPIAKKIYSIELVEEASIIAYDNANNNGIENIRFIAGDVLDEAELLKERPDLIVLDPPRSGIHPKSFKKILDLDPEHFIYVSCNPVALAEDLPKFIEHGYEVRKMESLNLFPMTTNVETVVLLSKVKAENETDL